MELREMMLNYRAKNAMSQDDLAKKVGVSRLTIWNAENGKSVSEVVERRIKMAIVEE